MRSPAVRLALLLLLLIAAAGYGATLPSRPAERGGSLFEPPAGAYTRDLTVALHPAGEETAISLTRGGTLPSAQVGESYVHPLRLRADRPHVVVLRASEIGTSAIHTAAYLMGEPPDLPVLVIAADPADLLGEEAGILHGAAREITATLIPIEGEGPACCTLAAGLRTEGPLEGKPSFRLTFRRRYGENEEPLTLSGLAFESKKLLLEGGGDRSPGALVDTWLLSQRAEAIGIATPACHPLLLYLDEEPWGLYLLRERLDLAYLRTHWGIEEADLRFGSDAHEGRQAAWDEALDALSALDPTDRAFYEEARRRFDIEGLINAILLTQALGEGRIAAVREARESAPWQWILNPDGQMEAEEGAARLHQRLLENPDYRAAFEARGYALAHGELSPSALLEAQAKAEAALEKAIAEDLLRWPRPPYALAGEPLAAWEAERSARAARLEARAEAFRRRYATPPAGESTGETATDLRPNDVIINEYWLADNGTPYASLEGRGIVGDWIELRTRRPHLDLRGWRLTDNNRKEATDEGSLIFPDLPALADLPQGTIILIIATENITNSRLFPADDLSPADGRLIFYVGNGHLDRDRDPGFALDPHQEALVLLAPGPTESFADDIGIDFVAEGRAVTPASFGVASDGVRFQAPFVGLGRDDGAIFTGDGSNDDGRVGWIVDPPPALSGDTDDPTSPNILTPGMPNERQGTPAAQRKIVLLALGASALLLAALLLRDRSEG